MDSSATVMETKRLLVATNDAVAARETVLTRSTVELSCRVFVSGTVRVDKSATVVEIKRLLVATSDAVAAIVTVLTLSTLAVSANV